MDISIIGFGKISFGYNKIGSQNLITHYGAILNSEYFELLSVFDTVNLDKDFLSPVETFSDFEQYLEHLNLNAPPIVVIASPTETHLYYLASLEKNLSYKPLIICEKPVANLRELPHFVCDRNLQSRVLFNYFRVSLPEASAVKNFINCNHSDEKFFIRFSYSSGIYNTLGHCLSLIKFLMPWFEIEAVSSDVSFIQKKGEDYFVSSMINLAGGGKFKLEHVDYFPNTNFFKIELVFEGSIIIVDSDGSFYMIPISENELFEGVKTEKIKELKIVGNSLSNYMMHFYELIELQCNSNKNSSFIYFDDAIQACSLNNEIRYHRFVSKLITGYKNGL